MAAKFAHELLRFVIKFEKGHVAKTPQLVERYENSLTTIKKGHQITVKNAEDVAKLENLIKDGGFKGLVGLPAAIAATNPALEKKVWELQKYPHIKAQIT